MYSNASQTRQTGYRDRLPLAAQRQRLSLALLIAAFVFCLLLLPQTVRGASWYQFHTIHTSVDDYSYADSENRKNGSEAFNQVPSINSAGQVAFWEVNKFIEHAGITTTSNYGRTIYRGDAGSLQPVVKSSFLDPQSPFSDFYLFPAINDAGDVAFSGNLQGLGSTAVVRFNQSSQTYTTIAEGSTSFDSDISWVGRPTINNAGHVAFNMEDGDDLPGVRVGSGGDLTHLADLLNRNAPTSIRVHSPTPEVMIVSEATANWKSIFTTDGTNSATIAALPGGSSVYESLSDTVSSFSSGNIPFFAFVGNPAGSIDQAVYFCSVGGQNTPNLNPIVVADTSGHFDKFESVAISTAGVAFAAQLDVTGKRGLYLVNEQFPTLWNTETVLEEGDTLYGHASSVVDVQMGSHAINDQGQIAMRVSFVDPHEPGTSSYAIVRADPFTLQTVHEAGMAMAAIKTDGDASMSQGVEFAPGNESLAFDFAFPAETGNLVVSLGGHVLAELDATHGAADRLARFETEVDLAALFPDGTSQAVLEFQLYSNDGTAGLYLDNIDFASLENRDFATGDLAGWQGTFAPGDGVGVAVNPYGPLVAVPEPTSALLLLAAAGLGWLWYRSSRAAKMIAALAG